MKKTLIKLFGIVAVIAALAIGSVGCKTVVSTNPDGVSVTNKVVNAEAIIPVINSVVPVGVQVAIAKDTNSVIYFTTASLAIDTLVANGNPDPAALQASLAALKINQPDAQLAIQAGLSIYKSFAADAVTAKLEKSESLKVLKALSDAIKQGLMFSTSPSVGKAVQVRVAK